MKSNITADPGLPEAFKVLKKEMHSLCLDMKLLNNGSEDIAMGDDFDEDRDFDITHRDEIKEISLDFGEGEGVSSLFDEDRMDEIGGLFNDLTEGTGDGGSGSSFIDSLIEDDEEFDFDFDSSETKLNDVEALLQGEFDDDGGK